jgi:uncharacterized membrane protein YwaF
MIDFLKKFFIYSSSEESPSLYSDTLGEGSFGIRHFLWMGLVILLGFLLYRFFKKYPVAGKKYVLIMAFLLFTTRLIHQFVRGAIGVEVPWTEAFPFHMCTVLTFVLPIVALFDIKVLKTPVYVLSIMGGIITILLGDYFDSRFMNFGALEGMSAHTLLILIPIVEIAIGRFSINFKESWKVILGILILMGWATLANEVFFKDYNPNYMYLRENALPFGDEGNFFFFYALIFLCFFGGIFGIPHLYRMLKKKAVAKARG